MPDVGLLSSMKPLSRDCKVVIRYSIEVNGLAVYNESYDLGTLARELMKNEEAVVRQWVRRLKCPVGCRRRCGFSACLTRCLIDGECCDEGHRPCRGV
jgi:hypothetical protein